MKSAAFPLVVFSIVPLKDWTLKCHGFFFHILGSGNTLLRSPAHQKEMRACHSPPGTNRTAKNKRQPNERPAYICRDGSSYELCGQINCGASV